MSKPSWDQLFSEAVKSSKNGVYYINEFVKQKAEEDLCGFYQYTNKSEYDKNSYKCGQTEVGATDRVAQQRTASTTEDFLIVGWIPSPLALNKSEDQKILRELHNQEKCVLRTVLDEDLTAKEWAVFKDNNPEEVIQDYLSKLENGLIKKDLELTIWQIEALDRLITFLDEGKQKIIAELAARFGKTLAYLALLNYIDQQVMIVGSYYLTALTSFKKEVALYKDFANFEILDLDDVNFQQSFDTYLKKGKKIVIIASLCGDKERNETVRNQNAGFVSKLSNKITVIDEADYGAHTNNCAPFVNKIGKGSPIILTTGTNSERAANNHRIDASFKVTYLDMKMKALSNNMVLKNHILKQCKRAVKFENNLVNVEFYRFDWSRFVPMLIGKNEDLNPSFSKCSVDVLKNTAFWTGLYQTMLGISSDIDLNDYSLSNCLRGNSESIIQFVSMSNAQLKKLEKVANSVLGQFYDVYAICGDDIEGKDAEQFVKDKIIVAKQNNKKVWIIASQMCQRSFSVADINVVLLSYDNGDLGATMQKISRALTNGNREKTGYIISLSIDGNRDDKIAPMIMDAAEQVAEHEGISLPDALRKVMKTFPIFQMDEDGYPVKLLPDEYAKELFSTSKGIRLAVNKESIYLTDLDSEAFDILSHLDVPSATIKQIREFVKGKTYQPREQTKELTKKEKDEMHSFILKNIVNILDNLAVTLHYQKMIRDRITYSDLIHILNNEKDSSTMVGVNGNQFSTLVDRGFIQKGILETFVELN
jgi:hypothetical protein